MNFGNIKFPPMLKDYVDNYIVNVYNENLINLT